MSDLETLFARYTFQELMVIIICVLAAVQCIWKLVEFQVGKKVDKVKWEKDLINSLESINEKIEILYKQNTETHLRQDKMERTVKGLKERMQENTRSYLIDAHTKFCDYFKKIDDLNLQSLERHYLYYKSDGGDTFIDQLMEDIRKLPRVGYVTPHSTGEEIWLTS